MPVARHLKLMLATLCLWWIPAVATAQVSVLMHHNDLGQTGQNLAETTLKTSNVNVTSFGKLFYRAVDGAIFAQPLYVGSLTIQGTTRNVVYVATQHNSVYAFDADDPNAAAPLWQVNLGTSVPSNDICIVDPQPGCPYQEILPEIGITSTPVIDTPTASGTIYVVAKTKDTANDSYHFFLHALDITSGAEKFGGPVEIAGHVAGSGTGSSGGTVTFDALHHNNRPGLLLANGVVYAMFGSVGDFGIFHGWIFGYNATTLQQTAIFNSAPNGEDGGIWQTGQMPLADSAGNIYLITGNGTFDANTGGPDYGDSFLKLTPGANGLTVADYFAPSNAGSLDANDTDLGSGGPLAVPGTTLIVGGGKDGVMRVVNTANMGKFHANSNGDVQEWQVNPAPSGSTLGLGSPVYWNSPNNGPVIYAWGAGDYLKAFAFAGGKFQTTPVTQSTFQTAAGFSNIVPMSLSANGSQAGTGIVWASAAYSGESNTNVVPAILRAFDATDLTKELWNSKQNAARDDVGNYAKFAPPTIANGKVYQPSASGQLVVYGINPPTPTGIAFAQVAAATPQAPSQAVSASYPATQTAGNLNIVAVGWNDTTSSVQSVGDSRGNSYSLAIGPTRGSGVSQSIYYAKNIAGGSNTVTVNFNQAAVFPDLRILEYNGLDKSSPFDAGAGGSGNSSTTDSGAVTTTTPSELLFGANYVMTATTGAGPGYTSRIITAPDADIAEDMVTTTTGSYHATATLSGAGEWVMQVAAFISGSDSGSTGPAISAITPVSGPTAGGTGVTITGSNFAAGATVSFGGTPATAVTVTGSTSITATTPPHAAGAVNVTVTNPDGQSATLTNGFTYAAAAAIGFVQVAAATPQSATQTVTVSYRNTQTAGNLNVIAIGWNDTTATVQSVTDSRGNSYQLAAGPTSGLNVRHCIYYARNIAGGSNTVTVTFSGAARYPDIRALEYAGVSALDKAAGASGNSRTASSGSVTTTAANELIFGANYVITGTTGAGTGFTSRIITTPDADIAEDRTVAATGTYSATAPLSPSGAWVMQIATFK